MRASPRLLPPIDPAENEQDEQILSQIGRGTTRQRKIGGSQHLASISKRKKREEENREKRTLSATEERRLFPSQSPMPAARRRVALPRPPPSTKPTRMPPPRRTRRRRRKDPALASTPGRRADQPRAAGARDRSVGLVG